jgi:aldehyde dehydrogenase (NAD+)
METKIDIKLFNPKEDRSRENIVFLCAGKDALSALCKTAADTAEAFNKEAGEVAASQCVENGKVARRWFVYVDSADYDSIEAALENILAKAREENIENLSLAISKGFEDCTEGIYKKLYLSNNNFDNHKKQGLSVKNTPFVNKKQINISLLLQDGYDLQKENKKLEINSKIASGISLARWLVNEPANVMTPSRLAEEAKKAGEKSGFSVKVYDEKQIQEMRLDETFMSIILREPIGVVGQIVPWNFPFLMAAWKLAPVIAAGDCTVFKPSSATSLSVLELARLIDGILPKGVFNVITGSGSKAGQYMLEHKGFKKLAFTGSTEVGRNVGLAAAEKIIPSTLELGGKSANIFFDDCDFDQAIDGAQLGILFNQGQVCCAGSRIFVQDTFYDEFVGALTKAFNAINVGDPLKPETQMGSQINRTQLKKILDYIEIGKLEGATVACGGVQIKEGGLEKGSFMRPTLLTNVTNDMRVAQEEIFGPVACVIKFKTEDEVIKMANDSVYGLGGAVWTKDIAKALHVARSIETGRMWVNTYNQIPEHSPFGGYKESGIGRETHKMILEHYTQKKNIMINLSYSPSGFYPKKY